MPENSKISLPEGFSADTLSIAQLEMYTSEGYAKLTTDAARVSALQEADKSVDSEDGEAPEKEASGEGFAALRNPKNLSIHERHTDTYWAPRETKLLSDVTLRHVRKARIEKAVAAGKLEEVAVKSLAFGVTEIAPAPTVQKTEVTAPAPDAPAEPTKPPIKLPEGIDIDGLTAAQLDVISDDKFSSMSEDAQRALLQQVGPPAASGPETIEEAKPADVAPVPVTEIAPAPAEAVSVTSPAEPATVEAAPSQADADF